MKKSQCTTMYKNNSGLIAKTKGSILKKGLCLTEKSVLKNPLLFLYETVVGNTQENEGDKKVFNLTNAPVPTSVGFGKLEILDSW